MHFKTILEYVNNAILCIFTEGEKTHKFFDFFIQKDKFDTFLLLSSMLKLLIIINHICTQSF